jgi:hypothetical protein
MPVEGSRVPFQQLLLYLGLNEVSAGGREWLWPSGRETTHLLKIFACSLRRTVHAPSESNFSALHTFHHFRPF